MVDSAQEAVRTAAAGRFDGALLVALYGSSVSQNAARDVDILVVWPDDDASPQRVNAFIADLAEQGLDPDVAWTTKTELTKQLEDHVDAGLYRRILKDGELIVSDDEFLGLLQGLLAQPNPEQEAIASIKARWQDIRQLQVRIANNVRFIAEYATGLSCIDDVQAEANALRDITQMWRHRNSNPPVSLKELSAIEERLAELVNQLAAS